MPNTESPFRRDALFLIAGPCQLEDDSLNLRVAERLARLAERVPGGIVFKASFDKANRSNPGAMRGPGLDAGLEALSRVRDATGLPLLTDVHLPEQCAPAAEVVDVLQIPAFLCRQTDLLQAAGATGKPVNIKKGQWMHPEGMRGAVEKVRQAARGCERLDLPSGEMVAVTERGTFFGYGDLVVDYRGVQRMRDACHAPVIFDGTHSVQQPGRGDGGASGGAREHIPTLTLAAAAAGVDGIFLETHPRPDEAPSDGPNMIPLGQLDALVERVLRVWEAARMIAADVARRVRWVGLDVDGVLTDGGIFLGDANGERVELKRYDIQDGLAIVLLRMAGIRIGIVTGRVSESVRLRAAELGADDVVQDARARKLPAVKQIAATRGLSLAEMAFVGDDLPDVGVLRAVGLGVAVGNATTEAAMAAQVRLTRNGGQGAVREFAELLLRARGEWDAIVDRYVDSRSADVEPEGVVP